MTSLGNVRFWPKPAIGQSRLATLSRRSPFAIPDILTLLRSDPGSKLAASRLRRNREGRLNLCDQRFDTFLGITCESVSEGRREPCNMSLR